MNSKSIHMQDIKKILLCCSAILLLLIGVLFLYWEAELKDNDRPISHRTEVLTNEFELTVGEIRGINIKRKHELDDVELVVCIEDKEGNSVWQNSYEHIDIASQYQEIEHFYPENLIDVPAGKYNAKFYVDGLEDFEIRGEFVEYRASYSKYFMVFAVLVMILVVSSIIVILQRNLDISKKYFMLAILLGIFYSFIFPALSMPDELTHFGEAYKISSTILRQPVCDEEGYFFLRADDYDSITYLHNIDTVSEWYESSIRGSITEMVTSDQNYTISIRAKYAYIVSAIGITIARLFQWSGRVLLSFGRLCNLFFLTTIIALAIHITPKFKLFMTAIGLLPETILLMNSYSYDGLNIAMSVLIVAFFLYLYDKEQCSLKEIIIFLALLLVFVPVKIVYVPFVLLFVLLPKSKIQITSKILYLVMGILLIGVAICVWLNLSSILDLVFRPTRGAAGDLPILINANYVLNHPGQIINMYARTMFENSYSYIQSMTGTVYSINRFGEMLSYSTPSWLLIVIFSICAVSILNEEVKGAQHILKNRVVVAVIVVFSLLAISVSMLFACTMSDYRKIEGIQGRYFLPLLLLLPILIRKRKLYGVEHIENKCLVVMQVVNMCFAWSTMHYYISTYFNV